MKSLSDNILTAGFDISGTHLIEASAGTGKTYSLQTIFLRLIVAEGVPIQKILVVTFTDAATKELRERLRAILEKCRHANNIPDNDPDKKRINGILQLKLNGVPEEYKDINEHDIRKRRIELALLDFDQAAIHTIHGFCQRGLQEFAFESGYNFDTEIVNSDVRLQQICNDWWRQKKYLTPNTLSEYILQKNLLNPGELLALIKTIIKRPLATILPEYTDNTITEIENKLKDIILNIIAYIKENKEDIIISINTEEAGNFISADAIEIIQNYLNRLTSNTPVELQHACAYLDELTEHLSPHSKINNYHIPPEVQECIEACTKCHNLIMNPDNGFIIKKGICTMNDNIREEWNEASKNAAQTINKHYKKLCRILDDDINFYKKNNLSNPEKRNKYFALIQGQQPPEAALKTAYKTVAALDRKKTLKWNTPKTIKTLNAEIAEMQEPENTLYYALLAKDTSIIINKYNLEKYDAHEITYDDMIQQLHTALTGKQNDALCSAMREKYQAALIDEFQDTDPVQYEIFKIIFIDGNLPVFLVGDPKQAIYSFRGGDVFTYSLAANLIANDNKYSLDTNYRSQTPLINAVNTIFANRPPADNAVRDSESIFGPKISYHEKLKCHDLEMRFIDNGTIDKQPFKIWKYTKTEGEKSSESYQSSDAMLIYSDVANEIVRLLNNNNTGFVPYNQKTETYSDEIKPVKPSDIVVLVRRHAEAAFIYRQLQKRNVPVVRQSGDNVFDSSEALELLYLLRAMANPENITEIKTALASRLLPVTNSEIIALTEGDSISYIAEHTLGINSLPESLSQWIAFFKETNRTWQEKDFATAFAVLTEKTGLNINITGQTSGERRYAAVKQLHDLIQQTISERHLGPEGVVKWFIKQLSSEAREENDAFETQLESDNNAVHIMTIFKSKGLEFPIVFIPTMWTGILSGTTEPCLIYHDTETAKTILQINKADSTAKETAKEEKHEEDIRNFYVAATRASYRTYVITKESGQKESTINHCLPGDLLDEWHKDSTTGIDVTLHTFCSRKQENFIQKNKTIDNALTARKPSIGKIHKHASFSSIAPHGHISEISDIRDFDAGDIIKEDSAEQDKNELDIFSFPAGAQTGECWHRIFEILNFTADDETIRNTVNEQLAIFRLDSGNEKIATIKQNIVFNMVKNVLYAELKTEGKHTFKLADISEKQKLAEMAFDFALNPGKNDTNVIRDVLQKHWTNANGDNKQFLERIAHWETIIPDGFMTGFIDLLFKHNEKYYILDWKSNRLNGEPTGFNHSGLVAEIATHAYFLQYLIYTVAVHNYLRQCLGNSYNYNKHFGGVLYIFLRGVNPENRNGIYYTKPAAPLIEDLSTTLTNQIEL